MAGASSPSPTVLANTWRKPQTFASTIAVDGAVSLNSTAAIAGLATLTGGISLPGLQYNALTSTFTTGHKTGMRSANYGVSIVPTCTGRVFLSAQIVVENDTVGDGILVYLLRSTIGIPAANTNADPSDAIIWANAISLLTIGTTQTYISIGPILDSGLMAGTTYYYYFAITAVTGGNASILGNALPTQSTTLLALQI